MFDIFIQVGIAITGMIAIWLTQQPDKVLARYASIFGLVGQPFWFYATYSAEQWGMFTLCFGYTYAWWIGFRRNWL